MSAEFYREGGSIDVTATKALTYHVPVAIGEVVAVPTASAAIGETVTCLTKGVFEIDKKAADVIAQGAVVYLLADGTIGAATADGAIAAGKAWADSAAADTTVLVKIN
jgi:predicted RecA/RadA family phage recombinase